MPINDVQPNIRPSELLEIKQFGGINLAVTPSQIADNECVDILNFMISEAGKLKKRTGYKKVIDSLGIGNINGFYIYDGDLYFTHKDKLYLLNRDNTLRVIFTGLNDHETTFFQMNNKLYILDGTNYLVYDGLNVSHVKDNAYVPTLFISCEPINGSGEEFEQWNLISKKFRQRYSPDGTATKYKLAFSNLDANTPVRVTADDVTWLSEGNGFSVDRVKGEVVFAIPPPKSTDSFTIEAGKDFGIDLVERITKCTLYTLYGGSNDTRVILSGNKETPSVIFRSGVYDPSYFPENYYQAVGNTGEKVTGFTIQYDYCVIFKEKSIWHMRFELNNGVASYPIRPLNDTVGCVNPNSIQLIENNPFFLDKRGIYTITQSTVRDEKNVQLISEKINYATFTGQVGLMQESNLDKAVSIDYDSKYMLCVNDKVYIFDYRNNSWYKWDNINAKALIEFENKLYFGDSNGTIYVFKEVDEMQSYDDIDKPVRTLWKSKIFDFLSDERYKLIEKMYIAMNTASRTSVDLYYITEGNEVVYVNKLILNLFNYATFDYSRFTYFATPYPVENSEKIKAKKVVYYQVVLENKEFNESLEVLSMDIKWRPQGFLK